MNRQETSKIVFTIKAVYPRHFDRMSSQELNNMIDVWTHFFRDTPYAEVSRGLDIFVMSNSTGFPPDPGQINKCIALDAPQNQMTATEAWAIVEHIVRGTPWDKYTEEYDKLPRTIQRAIGTAGSLREMGMVEESQFNNEKARFLRQYDAIVKREHDYAALPNSTRQAIESRYSGYLAHDADNEMRMLESAT